MSATVKPEDRNDGYAAMTAAAAGMREALEAISDLHIPDQPASSDMNEMSWAHQHVARLRLIARNALAAVPVQPAREAVRDRAASILDNRYPKVAAKIRAGMRSSTWPEDLIDPGLLLDLLEAVHPGLDPVTVEACELEADSLIGKHGSLDPWAKGFNAGCAASGDAIRALSGEKAT